MKTIIRIKDREVDRRVLAVDLRHVLAVLGEDALQSEWLVRGVWATGNASQELEHVPEDKRISGDYLNRLANDVVQVIDGEFLAFRKGARQPWVRIFADDSTLYEVETDDDEVKEKILRSFKDTELRPERNKNG